MYVCMWVGVYACMYACVYVCIYGHMGISMCMRIQANMHTDTVFDGCRGHLRAGGPGPGRVEGPGPALTR